MSPHELFELIWTHSALAKRGKTSEYCLILGQQKRGLNQIYSHFKM